MITAIIFILLLGLLILAHEMGHFLSARFFKVKAEEFGFGYPPRIFGLVKDEQGRRRLVGRKEKAEQFKNTVFSLNWLPLGGFVNIKGQDGEKGSDNDSYSGRPVWQRFIMLFSGVLMNFLLCFFLLSIGFMAGIPTMIDDHYDPGGQTIRDPRVQVISVLPDSPAQKAGIKTGDAILTINGKKIDSVAEMQGLTAAGKNQEITMTIERLGEEKNFLLKPEAENETAPAKIGVALTRTAIISYSWYEAIYRGAAATLSLTAAIVLAFAEIVRGLFTNGTITAEVAGPVGIAVMTGQVARLGWVYLLQFAALLSVNLAIINLLPIPALDGGRILFLIIEKIKGGPVKQKVESMIHQIGYILLMILMALVIFRDVRNYIF